MCSYYFILYLIKVNIFCLFCVVSAKYFSCLSILYTQFISFLFKPFRDIFHTSIFFHFCRYLVLHLKSYLSFLSWFFPHPSSQTLGKLLNFVTDFCITFLKLYILFIFQIHIIWILLVLTLMNSFCPDLSFFNSHWTWLKICISSQKVTCFMLSDAGSLEVEYIQNFIPQIVIFSMFCQLLCGLFYEILYSFLFFFF